MRKNINFIIWILLLAISSCGLINNTERKVNHLCSRSISESKAIGVFKGFIELESVDSCALKAQNDTIWYENAWKPSYFLAINIGVKKLDYYNLFFKNELGENINISILDESFNYMIPSYAIDPPLGYSFYIEKTINIEKLILEKTYNSKKCSYKMKYKSK